MNGQKIKKALLIIIIPVVYALLLRFVFDLDIIENFTAVMSVTFFISLPFGVGVITIAYPPLKK